MKINRFYSSSHCSDNHAHARRVLICSIIFFLLPFFSCAFKATTVTFLIQHSITLEFSAFTLITWRKQLINHKHGFLMKSRTSCLLRWKEEIFEIFVASDCCYNLQILLLLMLYKHNFKVAGNSNENFVKNEIFSHSGIFICDFYD